MVERADEAACTTPAAILKHVPAKWNPVRQGEPLFADKDMRQLGNLRRFPLIWDHRVIPDQRETL
jgi:hypothetical protein